MNKKTILKLAPMVLKRMEYGIDRFYLLNFNNDEIWAGNVASYLIISKLDGVKTLEQVINEVKDNFEDYNFDQIYESIIDIIRELLDKKFLAIVL